MRSILPLIFSLFLFTSCGQHSQSGEGKEGISNTNEVTAEALSQLVLQEDIEGLKKYADKGGDLEVELSNGRTLLTEACQWSKLKVIKFLVSQKVSLDKKDRDGKTAIDYGNEDIVIKRALFPELVIELKRGLFTAVKNNAMVELKKVLEENPPLNFILSSHELGPETADFEGDTLLTFCVKKKLENVLRLLAQPKYELNVNMVNAKGESPLKLAREYKYTNIEKLLLKLGAIE